MAGLSGGGCIVGGECVGEGLTGGGTMDGVVGGTVGGWVREGMVGDQVCQAFGRRGEVQTLYPAYFCKLGLIFSLC